MQAARTVIQAAAGLAATTQSKPVIPAPRKPVTWPPAGTCPRHATPLTGGPVIFTI
jgi:hypothetical protein